MQGSFCLDNEASPNQILATWHNGLNEQVPDDSQWAAKSWWWAIT
jgi:hypothetical protein